MAVNIIPSIFVATILVQLMVTSMAFKEEPNSRFGSATQAPTEAPPQSHGQTVQDIEREMRRLRTELSGATQTMRTLRSEVETEIALRKTRELQLTNRLSQLESNPSSGAQQTPCSGQLVAFTADVSRRITNLGDGQAIIFDSIVTNLGNHYNSTSGQFRVPVRGLYYFAVTIMSSPGESLTSQFFLNGFKEAVNFATADRLGGSGSNAILLDIHPGDLVWVALFQQFPGNVEPFKSSFSGHLVQQI